MTDEHRETGIGWPDREAERAAGREPVAGRAGGAPAVPPRPATDREPTAEVAPEVAADAAPEVDPDAVTERIPPATVAAATEPATVAAGTEPEPADDEPGAAAEAGRRSRPPSGASVMIALLLAVLGFTLVVQLRNVSDDPTLGAARQEDLVRILSDLQAREQRLNADIAQLEESKRQLASGVEGGEAALEQASRRADELGILAGTLPATGPGLLVRFAGNTDQVKARAVLDAVQELRGAGAEAMQISGVDGTAVRVVASTYFLDGEDGINVDGQQLTAPYTIAVIGEPETMRTALNIPGGVVELIGQAGGTVTMDDVSAVAVTARHKHTTLQYARPVP